MNALTYKVSLAEGADVDMTAEQIASAYNAGMVKPNTLVWRDGLDDWKTVAQLAGEVGVEVNLPPQKLEPRSRPPEKKPDYSEQPRPQKKAAGMSKLEKFGAIVVVLVIIVIFLHQREGGSPTRDADPLDTIAEQVIIGASRSPKSVDVVITERIQIGPGKARRKGYADGKNAFGVEVRDWWWVDIELINGKWQASDSSVLH